MMDFGWVMMDFGWILGGFWMDFDIYLNRFSEILDWL